MLKKTMNIKIFSPIFLSSLLAFSCALPHQVLAESTPKGREGLPGRRIGGGTRGGCSLNSGQLTALIPENNLGLTQTARPKLFFYLPSTSTSKLIEFVLQDENGNVIYEKNFTTTGNKGIININLSDLASTPALSVGKNYHWFVSIICNPQRREHDIAVDGWIKRVTLDARTAQILKRAKPIDQVNFYVNQGLWQDAIATLAQLRDKQPNNSQLWATWSQLLSSVKLDAIAKEPLLNIESQPKQLSKLK
ncbi:DUF928 domain-containing protein [Nostoc sp. FACHB-152]|nr:DUF928 domain-containing protein [Nostoc sp. FACHB-152]MBD2467669.1 DUF928 domain-containing protein [Nostoc sp. FACHB-145]